MSTLVRSPRALARAPALALLVAAFFLVPPGTGAPGVDAATPPARDLASLVTPALAAAFATHPDSVMEAFVSVEEPVDVAEILAVEAHGVTILRNFESFGVLYVAGTGRALASLVEIPSVTRLTENQEIEWHGDTGTVATRAREAWDAKSTSTTPVVVGGNVVDGSGIGIAVIDSGGDGTHPDLVDAYAMNVKYVCPTPVLVETASGHRKCFAPWAINRALGNLDNTCNEQAWTPMDDTDQYGHGTHVSGIIAGSGAASSGRFMGAAPGAKLHMLSIGVADRIIFTLEAFAWVDCHHASATPAIRIVSNSWGRSGEFDDDDPISKAVDALVAKGLTVVFSTGNRGPDGTVGPEAKNPTPGVIGVANYHDLDTGSRLGEMDATSSGCKATDTPNKCPDVMAPGSAIVSTRAKMDPIPPIPVNGVDYQPYYTTYSGTSMAAPHVSGIIALMLQVNPTLTPAQIEDILEDTAIEVATIGDYNIADPSNGGASMNKDAGHGLVDAIAALHDARVGATGGSPLPQIGGETRVLVFPRNAPAGVDPSHLTGLNPSPAALQYNAFVGDRARLVQTFLESGGVAWTLDRQLPCRFVITGAESKIASCASGLVRLADQTYHMQADTILAVAGTYVVEAQINYGSGFKAFRTFEIEATTPPA